MPGGEIGLETGLLQQPVQRHTHRANGGLGVIGAGERLRERVTLGSVEHRAGVHASGKRLQTVSDKQIIHLGEDLAHRREVDRQLAAHFQILRALPGEQGHDLALYLQPGAAVEDAFGMLPGSFLRLLREGISANLQRGARLFGVLSDKAHAGLAGFHFQGAAGVG